MNNRFEDLVAATRVTLERRADEIADSERMLAEIVDGGPRVTVDNGRHGNGWRFAAVAAAVVALLVGGLVVLRQLRDEPLRPATTDMAPSTTTPSSLPSTSTPPTPTTAAGWSPVLADVRDITFVDAQHGWALVGTGESSSDLLITSDGGRTWSSTGAKTNNAQHVVFADATNGWMYGGSFGDGPFRSTHDGGRTWNDVDLTAAGMVRAPLALASDGTTVAIVAAGVNASWTLATSPINSDAFSRVGLDFQQGAGPVVDFSVAVEGGDVWAVNNDRVVIDIGRMVDGSVNEWSVPWSDLGGPATLSVSRGGVLYANVWAGVWTGPAIEYQLYVSRDHGTTFTRVTLPLAPDSATSAVTAVDGDTVVAVISDPNGASGLYRSTDAGTTWTAVPTFPGDAMPPTRSVDGSTLVALRRAPDGSAVGLTISTDGGATWTSPS